MTFPKQPFYYIRHGQTDWNLRNITMGQMDIPLNQYGIQQAHVAAQKLKGHPIQSIITSPLLRAQQTASIIAETLQLSLIIHDDLKEAHFGRQQARDKGDASWHARWKNGEFQGGESYEAFSKRIVQSMEYILSCHTSPALIVAHGGAYWPIKDVLQTKLPHVSNCHIVLHEPSVIDEATVWQARLIE